MTFRITAAFCIILLELCSCIKSTQALYQALSAGLASFPTDIQVDETNIDLTGNNINIITAGDLQQFSLLSVLKAKTNNLSQFPDIRPVAATIREIDLSGQ